MFADFITPEFTYEYANTTIDHDTKKVTVVFDITDKYFDKSSLSEDTTASQITVDFEGTEATNATKELTKLSDITATINGVENTKVGEKYQLVVNNLDQGQGGDYSGIMTLGFQAGIATDLSNNSSLAKTITIGVDEPKEDVTGVKPSELFDSTGSNTEKLHIGDFINYDAGTWTQEEINSIQTGLKTNLQTANGSTDLPANTYQFGGFTAGSSRNENATPYIDITGGKKYGGYLKDTSTNSAITGWRVFDIDGDNITLISAGNPEDYNNPYGNDGSYISEYILSGNTNSSAPSDLELGSKYIARDWSMYVNASYGSRITATALTKTRLDQWYNKNYNLTSADTYNNSTFQKIYGTNNESLIDNYSYYWLASAYDGNRVCIVDPDNRFVGNYDDNAFGVRVLVSLPSGIQTSEPVGTKTVTSRDKDYTYNVWNIK